MEKVMLDNGLQFGTVTQNIKRLKFMAKTPEQNPRKERRSEKGIAKGPVKTGPRKR